MRRLMLVLALIGASVLFLGAAPGTASAANCASVHQDRTFWDGSSLVFWVYVGQCTSDVDTVQFGLNAQDGGWYDSTWATVKLANVASWGYCSGVACARYSYTGSWCFGQTHQVYTFFYYRIHNRTTNTWGTWHYNGTSPYYIVC